MSNKLGKIEHHLFDDYIKDKLGKPRKEVIHGPGFGVDTSIIDVGNGLGMAQTSDPLSLIPSLGLEESAWLSVHLMANDMATTGFAPMYGQFVLNLPATFSKSDFETYWEYIHKFCVDIGVTVTGGHTGFIEGQNSTIAGGGTFTTIAPLEEMLISKNAQVGDVILMTKQCALSSSAILALSFPETIKNKAGKDIYEQGCASFYNTSSLKDALTAVSLEKSGVTAMHDVTEGGVLGAAYEMARASGNGALIYSEMLPVGEVQSAICKIFEIDPRHCIGAGSMLITCKESSFNNISQNLKIKGINCQKIGIITDQTEGINISDHGEISPMVYQEEDPYWAAFFKAFKEEWK